MAWLHKSLVISALMIRFLIQKSAPEEDARNFNGGGCEPISAPLFMRGETTHHSFFTTFLTIKTATYAAFLQKKENKSSKKERRFQQVERAVFNFRMARRMLRTQDVDTFNFLHARSNLKTT